MSAIVSGNGSSQHHEKEFLATFGFLSHTRKLARHANITERRGQTHRTDSSFLLPNMVAVVLAGLQWYCSMIRFSCGGSISRSRWARHDVARPLKILLMSVGIESNESTFCYQYKRLWSLSVTNLCHSEEQHHVLGKRYALDDLLTASN